MELNWIEKQSKAGKVEGLQVFEHKSGKYKAFKATREALKNRSEQIIEEVPEFLSRPGIYVLYRQYTGVRSKKTETGVYVDKAEHKLSARVKFSGVVEVMMHQASQTADEIGYNKDGSVKHSQLWEHSICVIRADGRQFTKNELLAVQAMLMIQIKKLSKEHKEFRIVSLNRVSSEISRLAA